MVGPSKAKRKSINDFLFNQIGKDTTVVMYRPKGQTLAMVGVFSTDDLRKLLPSNQPKHADIESLYNSIKKQMEKI